MNGLALFAGVALLAATLTGCTANEPPATTPSPAGALSTPTAQADASPTVRADPNHLVVSSTSIQVVLDDGTLGDEFSYFEPIQPVVAALTDVFGEEPVVTEYEDAPTSVDYDWVGVSIGTDGPAQPPSGAEIIMFVTAPDVNGIGIETIDGIKVGDPAAPLEAANSSYRWQRDSGEELVVTMNSVPITSGDAERMFSVQLRALPADGPITQIGAPMKNFE